jgi:hypothetical protein
MYATCPNLPCSLCCTGMHDRLLVARSFLFCSKVNRYLGISVTFQFYVKYSNTYFFQNCQLPQTYGKVKVKISLLQAMEAHRVAPTLLRQTANRWRQGCKPYAPAALYPQVSLLLKIPGTHFC